MERVSFLLLAILSLLASIDCFESSSNATKSVFRRQLAETKGGNQKDMKKMMRSAKTIEFIEKTPIPSHFIPSAQSPPHNVAGPAILAAAMGQHMDRQVSIYMYYI